MEIKNNVKDLELTTRVQTYIPKTELRIWKKYFMPYGTKTEFERETGVLRQKLNKVLKSGKGEKTIVAVIRAFVETQRTEVAN